MIKNILLGAVLPLVLIGTGVGVFFGMQAPEAGKVPPIGTDRASLLAELPAADVQVVRSLSELSSTLNIPVNGTVVPFREIQLAAEVAGRVVEKNLDVQSGNFIKKGEVLFRIDPRDYELEIERLEGRRDQADASIKELEQEIENAQRLLEVAEEDYALAEADVQRFNSLRQGITSAAELDRAKRTRLNAMNQRVGVQNQLATLRSQRSRLQLSLKLAETELDQARLNLTRTEIKAPVDGIIVAEQVEEDSYVQRGTPLVTIEDTENVEVATNLRMDQLYWVLDKNALSADQLVNAAQASRYELPKLPVKVQFELSGRESLVYEWIGILDRYDGAGLDPQSRTVPVRVLVQEPEKFTINGRPANTSASSGPSTLVRGMFVNVSIQTQPATQLLLVPKLSVKPATNSNRIWQFRPDAAALDTVLAKNELSDLKPADEAAGEAKNVASTASESLADANENGVAENERKVKLDPDAWRAGFLRILDGVQVVGAFDPATYPDADFGNAAEASDVEYLICEVQSNTLRPGDFVVVTPLPGIEAEGEEAIRVAVDQLGAK